MPSVQGLPALSVAPSHHPADKLAGRTVVVTGAGSGIGAETARVLGAEGATVVASDRDAGSLERQLGTAERTVIVTTDVRDERDCRRLVDTAVRHTDRLDVLVNNAGVTVRGGIAETSDELWARAVEVNLHAVARLCRLAVPVMRRQRSGAIVNVSSITALRGHPGAIAYSAAKGGVTAMTRSLALELAGDRIRVNSVCPAVVDSPMTHEYVSTRADVESAYAELVAKQPLGRLASPRDVALAILFLASDDALYITGVALPVDGGRHAA
jgi:3-oxoacyl-[acyl-carrier protein] reductase